MVSRRDFLLSAAATAGLPLFGAVTDAGVNETLPKWKAGELDIHFIHTGCGEQTFFVFPDGTTMLLDCGDMYRPQYLQHVPLQPFPNRLGGEWVSRYVQRIVSERTIDYFALTHWHSDHIGNPELRQETTKDGRIVCGITRFAEDFDIRHYFDHQYPHFGQYARNVDAASMKMVRDWLPFMKRRCGMEAHPFTVGALNEIALLKDRAAYPDFEIRNLFSNCIYWDGTGGLVDYKPEYARLNPSYGGGINENTLSLGFRLRYGAFSAYFGGDIDFPAHEAKLGPIVGPIDICKMNHHGCPSSMGATFCRAVDAQVYFGSVWSPNQITDANMPNMAARTASGAMPVVSRGYLPTVKREAYAGKPFMDAFAPAFGHTVFKVAPGGKTFDLYVVSAADESMQVLYRRTFTGRGLS